MNKKKVLSAIALLLLILLLIYPEIYLRPAYTLVIKPVGESSIETATRQAIQVSNTSERLHKIAEREVEDFKGVYKMEPDFFLDFFVNTPFILIPI